MKTIPLHDNLFAGAISLERTDEWVKPWRLPFADFDLFPPDGIGGKAEIPAGVRLHFQSDTAEVRLGIVPSDVELQIDCVVNGDLHETATAPPGSHSVTFRNLPAGTKRIELYLSQKAPMRITQLEIQRDASWDVPADHRLRWLTYGSSITQCAAAASPAQTWPALVARAFDLHLTCLGYGGNCHLEPMVARMIRDWPADLISLCLGINVMGSASLGPRTFKAAVIGFITILREKHPDTPIAVMSPIISPPRETTPNAVGLTLTKMREEIESAVALLVARGDRNLLYVNGLEVFGESLVPHLPDLLHPDAEGYRLMAENFKRAAMEKLLGLHAGQQNQTA